MQWGRRDGEEEVGSHPWVLAVSGTVSLHAGPSSTGDADSGHGPFRLGRTLQSLSAPAPIFRPFPTTSLPAASGHQTSCPQKVLPWARTRG